jgi:SpoVK/Ycf46/Vps4 family AAA+-type ATPase
MFPNFKKDKKKEIDVDKNLKMMIISVIVLIVLFLYTITKSDNVIHGSSYYIGIGFLFILLMLTFALQKYKDKFRKMITKDKFSNQLEKAQDEYDSDESTIKKSEHNSSIIPISSNITFKDVAGIEDIKGELEEVVDFLNNPKKYQKYNVQLP